MTKTIALHTSREIKQLRKLLGWSQQELADRVGCHVQTVKYWEGKRGAIKGKMIMRFGAVFAAPEVFSRLSAVINRSRQASQPRCGAKTRKGTPCRAKPMSGRRRCKLHGGMSTGPRTEEGRVRIAEAQRSRWARLKT